MFKRAIGILSGILLLVSLSACIPGETVIQNGVPVMIPGANSSNPLFVSGGGNNLTFAQGINWLGEFATPPVSANVADAYFNTANGSSYVWNGASWDLLAQSGAAGNGTTNLSWGNILGNLPDQVDLQTQLSAINTTISGKQATLVSGTNIKTINGNSLLGAGDLTVGGTIPNMTGQSGKFLTNNGTDALWAAIGNTTWGNITGNLYDQTDLQTQLLAINSTISGKANINHSHDASNITGGSTNQTISWIGGVAQWVNTGYQWIVERLGFAPADNVTVQNHIANNSNPHNVTADQVVANLSKSANYHLTWNGTNAVFMPPPSVGLTTFYFQNATDNFSDYKRLTTTIEATQSSNITSGVTNNQTLMNLITDAGVPGLTFIPAGEYEVHAHASQTAGTKVSQLHAEIWETWNNGTDLQMIGAAENSPILTGTPTEFDLVLVNNNPYTLNSTSSRLLVRIHAVVTGAGTAPTINISMGGTADSHFALPSSTVDTTNFVPYTGATQNINIGSKNITATAVNSTYYIGGTLNQTIISDGAKGSWTTLLVGHISDFWTQITSYVTTRLAAFTGSTNISTLGTIITGTWNGSIIQDLFISSATYWNNHVQSSNNPHNTTAQQVGAAPTAGNSSIIAVGTITTGTWNGTTIKDLYIASANYWNAHAQNSSNPHNVTADQVAALPTANVSGANITASNTTVPTSAAVKTYADNASPIRITARLFGDNITVTAQNDTAYFGVTDDFIGRNITALWAFVSTNSTSGNVTVNFYNMRSGLVIGLVVIDANKGSNYDSATPVSLNSSNSGLQVGDRIRFDVIYAGTGAKGLQAGFKATK